jgi:hypothetical protein
MSSVTAERNGSNAVGLGMKNPQATARRRVPQHGFPVLSPGECETPISAERYRSNIATVTPEGARTSKLGQIPETEGCPIGRESDEVAAASRNRILAIGGKIR